MTFIFIFGGEFCREKNVINFLLHQFIRDHLSYILRNQVRLVKNKKTSLIDLFDPIFQTVAPVEKWISAVNNLNNQIRSLNDSPKLSPNLEVLLIRSDSNVWVALLHISEFFSPTKEGLFFIYLLLVFGLTLPLRSSRYFQVFDSVQNLRSLSLVVDTLVDPLLLNDNPLVIVENTILILDFQTLRIKFGLLDKLL
jgi:hypothetical protein